MEDDAWTRVAAYVLCRDAEKRILLCRNSAEIVGYEGWWTMPGGKVEWGEHPVDAATRELEEETGLTADIGEVMGVFSRVYERSDERDRPPMHIIGFVFRGTNPRGTLRHEAVGTTDRAAWFTLDEARALPHVGQVDFCLGLCD